MAPSDHFHHTEDDVHLSPDEVSLFLWGPLSFFGREVEPVLSYGRFQSADPVRNIYPANVMFIDKQGRGRGAGCSMSFGSEGAHLCKKRSSRDLFFFFFCLDHHEIFVLTQ